MESTPDGRWEVIFARAREQLEADPLYRRSAWVAAHSRLLALLPAACAAIPAPYMMTPDGIYLAANASGLSVEPILLFNPWRIQSKGLGTKAFEELDPLELFDTVFADLPPDTGPIWLITDDCFGTRDPFAVCGEELRNFVASSSCSLHDDAIFIWGDAARVSVVHHEGAFFHIVVPSSPVMPT